jgi:ABC-type Fe3+/spermidine/putrescine transport system ATPase subunit
MSCEVRGLSKTYPGFRLSLDFSVETGEFVSLVGPSGCGKTTALRIIAGLEAADSGMVSIDGRDVSLLPPEKRGVGFIFQDHSLFPHLNVERNVGYGLDIRGVPKLEREERVAALLESMHLAGYEKREPWGLSGGEGQRVALARALAVRPDLVLFDEPLSALDPALRRSMSAAIREARRKIGFTTLYVTHDQGEALSLSDRIIVLRSGGIEQIGSPEEIYGNPRNPFVADFFGGGNSIPGRIIGTAGGSATVETSLGRFKAGTPFPGRSEGKSGTFFFRAEDSTVVSGAERTGMNLIRGRIADIEFEGYRSRISVDCGSGFGVSAYVPATEKPAIGENILVGVPLDAGIVFIDD